MPHNDTREVGVGISSCPVFLPEAQRFSVQRLFSACDWGQDLSAYRDSDILFSTLLRIGGIT